MYDYHCSLLEGPLARENSTTYGVNCCSPLNNIDYFHVANSQLPQDVMHVLLEGVLSRETQMLLDSFVNMKRYFTVEFLNARIKYFTYGHTETRNKPPQPFTSGNLASGNRLPLSGMHA